VIKAEQRRVKKDLTHAWSVVSLGDHSWMVYEGAIRLYESLGFVRRPAYYDTPLPETVFMELQL